MDLTYPGRIMLTNLRCHIKRTLICSAQIGRFHLFKYIHRSLQLCAISERDNFNQASGEKTAVEAKKSRKKNEEKNNEDTQVEDKIKDQENSGKSSDKTAINNQTKDGRKGNLKIVSWNCAGFKACVKKDGLSYLKTEEADIICLQETKCTEKDCPSEIGAMKVGGLNFVKDQKNKYNMYFCDGEKKGYSGTALWTKTKPLNVTYGLGIEEHDKEGRLITAEYDKFYLVTAYVPNSGRGLVRLDYRMKWEKDMREYLKKLDAVKPVIFCGDLNVAHDEIDIANPKSNQKNAGFTKEERKAFTELLDTGFIDSFRHLYPDRKGEYTFWTYMGNARERNIGWRLDYFVLSNSIVDKLCDSITRQSIKGSDHCPVVLMMAM